MKGNRVAVSVAAVAVLLLTGCGLASRSEHSVRQGPVELVGAASRPIGPAAAALPVARPLASVVPALPAGCTSVTQAMKVLVISADGSETVLPAIQQALDYHSVPYATWIAADKPGQLAAGQLATGCAGQYQAVILTTNGLVYESGGNWASALTTTEWEALRAYEAGFGVRELAWYAYPGPDIGLNPPSSAFDTTGSPLSATWTAAGLAAFPYVNAASPIAISMAWTYLSTPLDATVTPLLVDGEGNALVSTRLGPDGRETMALTFDSNPYLLHDMVLAHGLVEWVTKGLYLGEFRAYLTPQVDDLLIDDDLYTGGVYRMTAADFNGTTAWQRALQTSDAGLSGFRLAFAFNGEGGATNGTDPLSNAVKAGSANYLFINHTFTHLNLDAASYRTTATEIKNDNNFGKNLRLKNFYNTNFVSPDVSGLNNANALRALVDNGIRYAVSDTSQPGWGNPAPNIGITSTLQPRLLLVPRRPTNLFYNVSLPQEWAAEYNFFYRGYWGRDLSYDEILDKESEVLLQYMLRGDLDPQMYHQSNLRLYDGKASLLSDLHDAALRKYRTVSTLPVKSADLQVAGKRMADTMARNKAGLSAVLSPGVSVTLSSPTTINVVLSGACRSGAENYGGKCIYTVRVAGGVPTVVPLQ